MAGVYESIREQIMEAVKVRLEGMAFPTYGLQFDLVQRTELDSGVKGKEFTAGIFDDIEENTPDTDPVMRRQLGVEIEFQIYIQNTENPRTKMNMVYSEVERALKSDRTFGGLAIDLEVNRTQTSIEGRFDKYVEGLMSVTIKFRTNNADPREAV